MWKNWLWICSATAGTALEEAGAEELRKRG